MWSEPVPAALTLAFRPPRIGAAPFEASGPNRGIAPEPLDPRNGDSHLVVVVGDRQAGLAIGYFLAQQGRDYLEATGLIRQTTASRIGRRLSDRDR